MQLFVSKPNISLYSGVKVTKDTVLEFENENVKQSIKDLVFRSLTTAKGENYESTYDTTIYLKEGDVLIFEEADRGYILPYGQSFVTVAEAIEDLNNIKDIGGAE